MIALARQAPVSWQVITAEGRLRELASEWEALAERSDQDQPTVSPAWILAWWRAFGAEGGRRLRVVTVRRAGRLIGLAPLASRAAWDRQTLPSRRLELVPSGEPEADDIASDYIGVVAERGCEQAVGDALAEAIAGGALGPWDELVLPRMNLDGPMVPVLATALEGLGRVVFSVSSGSPYIPLPATWDEYLAQLSASNRRRVRQSLRAFDAWTGGHARLRVARTRAELEEGTRVLRELHGQRWRAAGELGVFASARFAAFHGEVMPALLEKGALELMWLCAHGEPVAALYNIVWNGAVQFYQSGRRTDLPGNLRPGLVIHALAIRRAIELGRREYDFLTGTSRHKQELALAVRPMGTLRILRPGAVDRARLLYERGVALVRAARASRPSG
ncbi:MAG TPA: GNAT family N-acetyltransferase [Kofleriaceae bacterium]|nr:GNAT family N-acetyltransferase [Kofleriaceae bacterium]